MWRKQKSLQIVVIFPIRRLPSARLRTWQSRTPLSFPEHDLANWRAEEGTSNRRTINRFGHLRFAVLAGREPNSLALIQREIEVPIAFASAELWVRISIILAWHVLSIKVHSVGFLRGSILLRLPKWFAGCNMQNIR